jgi:hypothetical protein
MKKLTDHKIKFELFAKGCLDFPLARSSNVRLTGLGPDAPYIPAKKTFFTSKIHQY